MRKADAREGKRMELQSKLKEYAACFDESPVALAVLRVLKDDSGAASDFEYLYCNDAFAFIEGAARGQIIGRRHYERYPDAGGKWLEFYDRAVSSGSAHSSGDFSAEHNKFLSVRAFSIGADSCLSLTPAASWRSTERSTTWAFSPQGSTTRSR